MKSQARERLLTLATHDNYTQQLERTTIATTIAQLEQQVASQVEILTRLLVCVCVCRPFSFSFSFCSCGVVHSLLWLLLSSFDMASSSCDERLVSNSHLALLTWVSENKLARITSSSSTSGSLRKRHQPDDTTHAQEE
jgi:hypothetical protein